MTGAEKLEPHLDRKYQQAARTHGEVQEGGPVTGGGVPERNRPDLGAERRPGPERQPTGAATGEGT